MILYLKMANLLPNLKFNIFFWKHCLINTQVSLMLINRAIKPNLLWFIRIVTLLNTSKNSFGRDLLQLYWRASCTITFGGLMLAQGLAAMQCLIANLQRDSETPFIVITLLLSVMEHTMMSCSFSSWFER